MAYRLYMPLVTTITHYQALDMSALWLVEVVVDIDLGLCIPYCKMFVFTTTPLTREFCTDLVLD